MIEDFPLNRMPAATAYAVWRLRQQVFILEQACLYPDLDGRDTEPGTRHVVLTGEADEVAGYLRVLDDGTEWRIGRVVLDPASRGKGLANPLMEHALTLTTGRDVVLDAQSPLARWYGGFGFVQDGPEFLEDDIPHTPMRLTR